MRKDSGGKMIQWLGVIFTLLGLVYTGVKDYQKGDIKIPTIPKHLTVQKYPVQYCLMAYDPNLNKVFYLHENGQWHDFAPQIRQYQNQGQASLGTLNGTQRTSQHGYGQSAQTYANP
jgi:hypothetical protein